MTVNTPTINSNNIAEPKGILPSNLRVAKIGMRIININNVVISFFCRRKYDIIIDAVIRMKGIVFLTNFLDTCII